MGGGRQEVVFSDPRGWGSLETAGFRQACLGREQLGSPSGGVWELETLLELLPETERKQNTQVSPSLWLTLMTQSRA